MKSIQYSKNQLLGSCKYIKEAEKVGKHRYAFFECPVCNKEFSARIDHIKASKISNCGCVLNRESHGNSNTRLYHIWEAIKQRCDNPKNPNYKNYGAKGVTLYKLWYSYTAFESWALSNGYSETLTIERVNVEGNYEPLNCTWASIFTQQANKRFEKENKTGFTGIELSKGNNYTARLRVNGSRINLGTFPTAEAAAKARDAYIKAHNLPHKLNFP